MTMPQLDVCIHLHGLCRATSLEATPAVDLHSVPAIGNGHAHTEKESERERDGEEEREGGRKGGERDRERGRGKGTGGEGKGEGGREGGRGPN